MTESEKQDLLNQVDEIKALIVIMGEKADKWDQLKILVDDFYENASGDPEENGGLITLGVMTAVAFGYL